MQKSIVKSKLATGLVVAALTAAVGAAGVGAVYAATTPTPPANKEACKNDGWKALGFKNQGQCVSAVEHNKHHGGGNGGGYGGNNTVNANVNVELNNSNNNIITVIVRMIFGD